MGSPYRVLRCLPGGGRDMQVFSTRRTLGDLFSRKSFDSSIGRECGWRRVENKGSPNEIDQDASTCEMRRRRGSQRDSQPIPAASLSKLSEKGKAWPHR